MSTIDRPDEYNNSPANYANISMVNKIQGNTTAIYNSGKKTMLDPLQNNDWRKNMRKEMNKNYKHELDQQ
jgi:hypothetical protein